jgi:hypothetical protein
MWVPGLSEEHHTPGSRNARREIKCMTPIGPTSMAVDIKKKLLHISSVPCKQLEEAKRLTIEVLPELWKGGRQRQEGTGYKPT